MKNIEYYILFAIAVLMLLLIFALPAPTYQIVNCSLVEISPDFTAEHRKECREIRATKL
jgi:hypothetical protein